MNRNPYEAGLTSLDQPKTQATRWMIITGWILIGLAVFCLLVTLLLMKSSFDTIATSPTAPKPAELAGGISDAMFLSTAVISLGLSGLAFFVMGLAIRQPAPNS